MKKHYIEASLLTIIYLSVSFFLITFIGTDANHTVNILTYPAQICLGTIINKDYNIEAINLSIFGIYFLWSFNCVYLSVIRSAIQAFKLNKS